jgi:hypothetical protein
MTEGACACSEWRSAHAGDSLPLRIRYSFREHPPSADRTTIRPGALEPITP